MQMKYLKVKSIKKCNIRNTYDLSVEGNENFFINNGILSHNSSKSTSLLSLCQKYHDNPHRRYKIIDLHGGDRKEGTFWCLPSEDKGYWKKLEKKLKLDEAGPKEYQVHLLYPCFSKTLPAKLPHHPPRVTSSIFTIPFKSLEIDDLNLVLGNISETGQQQFRLLKEDVKVGDNSADILHKATKLVANNSLLFGSFIKIMCENLLFQPENHQNNLDVYAEIKDKETITVLCLDFIPKEYHIFFMGWIMRQINKLLDSGKQIGHVIGFIREAAEFFRATDQALVPDRMKIFRTQLAHFIRMGRRGMHLCVDENTEIKTDKGNFKISELPETFKVASYNFGKKKEEFQAAIKIDTGKKECIQMTLEDGSTIILTEDHKLFKENGEEIHAGELKVGDNILAKL